MSDTIFMGGRAFRVERTMVDATTMTKPDTSWLFVDPSGHIHRWVDGKLPTVVVVSDGEYWCSDCNDTHARLHYECLFCSSRVEPRSTSNHEQQFVVGLRRLYVDDRPATPAEFKRKWLDAGGDPVVVKEM